MKRSDDEGRPSVGQETSPSPRMDRRKARTRAALVRAAQRLLAEGRSHVAILEITQIADVGMGSFYNHFQSKDDLFKAAVDDALERHGDLLDELSTELDDPAEVFARSFRLTGRLHRLAPELSKVLLASAPSLAPADGGLAPRALRDIERAQAAGRFTVEDPEIALVAAGGAILALGHLLHRQPDRDDAAAADRLTEGMLRMFGVPADEAAEICRRPLPDLMSVVGRQAGDPV